MDLVLWIDRNEFATGLFERVFKQKGHGFYTIASARDFAHLIQDLAPGVIVIDASTALADLEVFKLQYESTSKFQGRPVIIRDPLQGLEFIENINGEINGPIDPFELPELLAKMMV